MKDEPDFVAARKDLKARVGVVKGGILGVLGDADTLGGDLLQKSAT
jgi:hypothetical protein